MPAAASDVSCSTRERNAIVRTSRHPRLEISAGLLARPAATVRALLRMSSATDLRLGTSKRYAGLMHATSIRGHPENCVNGLMDSLPKEAPPTAESDWVR